MNAHQTAKLDAIIEDATVDAAATAAVLDRPTKNSAVARGRLAGPAPAFPPCLLVAHVALRRRRRQPVLG